MTHRSPRRARPPARPSASTQLFLALATVGALLAGIGTWWASRTADDGLLLPRDCAPTKLLEPPCGAWWGAYVPYAANGSLVDAVDGLERKIGRRLDLVYTYHDMSNTQRDGVLLTPDERRLGEDRMLMLAWESTIWTEPHHKNYTETQLGWGRVAAGDFDKSVIDPQAERIKDYGKTVFFSFDQETDFRTPEAGTPAEFIAAYRHVYDRFKQLGVDNVIWVWTVSGYLGHKDLMKELYPGDDYVDWIGMDQYNYYRCHNSDWLDFRQSQQPSYDWLRKNVSDDKPIMMSEFSTAPDPEDPSRQKDWYEQIPDAAPHLPDVKAMVQWDSPIPGPDCDLRADHGPALEGYRKAGEAPYVNQPLPAQVR
ncbi:glycoside hydrolase family 26 protein [Streptomyces fuscigenes]|uniref:glycoside hydrolase family 26 protein n=1 Tax=Streptomyces fuscigenes TaxID=1528880 RepID=UPI001F48EAED|nr:glycosyl hydrolase [Streptomyces fuscigenes]MCF3960755.1 glycoside hydrolase family 26 protein [Streptomyces fuscigenes]